MRFKTTHCLLVFILFFCVSSVKLFAQNNLPADLKQSIEYFENKWTLAEKDSFKIKTESIAVTQHQVTTGMWIRNNWLRGKKDTVLLHFFMDNGIEHPDDISAIILTSLHRKLNEKQINFEGQLQKYQTHHSTITECKEEVKQKAFSNYNKYKVGDAIKIFMHVDVVNGQRNAVLINCPNPEWEFDEKKDLQMDAVITKKYLSENKEDCFFEVNLKKIYSENTTVLGEPIEFDDFIDFNLKLLRIE